MFTSRKRRKGAALLEFAFVGFLFFGLLLGMVQFGIYLSVTNALWSVSREGARYAAVQKSTDASANDKIIAHIKLAAPSMISTADANKFKIAITPAAASGRTGGTPVTVQISYDMSGKNVLLLPLNLFGFYKKTLGNTYVTQTTMMVESS